MFCFITGSLIVYGLDVATPAFYNQHYPGPFVDIVYGTFHRLAWGLCLSWVVLACQHGFGGFINDFLSWEGFAPLSRLTFVVYLLHQSVINVLMSQCTFNYEWSGRTMAMFIVNVLFITTVISSFVEIMIEMPLLHLEKNLFVLFTSKGKSHKNK